MLPPTPLSLLCAILLCLPLAVIFTFTAPSSTTSSPVLPIIIVSSSSINYTNTIDDKLYSEPIILLPPPIASTKPHLIIFKNQTTANSTNPPPRSTQALAEEYIDGDDDRALFQAASRVNPSPKPPKKLAFMFLTTSPLPFTPLWDLFFSRAPKNLYNVYVHADPSSVNHSSLRGVFAGRVVVPSKPTRRHTPTLISAARRLLAHGLLHDESNSMFALFSPSCIPIHSFSYTYRTLIRSRRSFVEILKKEPGAYERWAARGEGAMPPEVEFSDFRIGSQFWAVKRKHARMIVRDRRVWSKFKLPCLRDDTCYPEEHYFATLLGMVDPRGCTPCTLTHVDWKGSRGGHPRMYKSSEVGPDLIRSLRKRRPRYGDEEGSDGSNSSHVRRRHDPFLFARKFYPGSLHRLLSIANGVIFKD